MIQNQRYIAAQAKIFKALGHPSRLTMVTALRENEKCVCELQQIVGCDMSTISKHLGVLKEAGVVSTEKKGTSVYYKLTLSCLDRFLTCTGKIVEASAIKQIGLLK